MGRRVLLIQEAPTDSDLDLAGILSSPEQYACAQLPWSKVRPDDLAGSNADLIVAVADSHTAEAIEIFRRFSARPKGQISFAILPRQIDAGLLRSAAECVDDFVLWPTSRAELGERIRRLLGSSQGESDATGVRLLREIGFAQLVGEDPAFLRALEKILVIATRDVPVLITGETGTGKEFVARAIHHLGKRRSFPFVPVDGGAVPDHVFENELFGHVRGGYTDAYSDQKGLAEIADKGTLFLDEIDSLSAMAQAKLLRFLQERTFKPLGSNRFVTVDVQIIAATNRDLEACVRERQFRADLYFRLNVLRITLPPLRERPLDIPLLARHFLRSLGLDGAGCHSFSAAALRKLALYPWPGNVRELSNVIQQSAVRCDGPQILPQHILLPMTRDSAEIPMTYRDAREQVIRSFEKSYLEDLLRNCGGNVTRAAKEAHQHRRAIGRLMKKHHIDRAAL